MPSALMLPQPSYKKTLLSVLVAIGIFAFGVGADRWLAISGWLAWFDEAGAWSCQQTAGTLMARRMAIDSITLLEDLMFKVLY